jgi:hypothetical protein
MCPRTESVTWPIIICLSEPVTVMNSKTAIMPMTMSNSVSAARRPDKGNEGGRLDAEIGTLDGGDGDVAADVGF